MAVIWSVNDYFYVAGSLNAENLHGDIWLNFSLVALTEAPAAFVGTFLMGKTTQSINIDLNPLFTAPKFLKRLQLLKL